MKDDLELKQWQSLWQTNVEMPSDLLKKAGRQLRRTRMMLIADIGITVGAGGLSIFWAMATGKPSVHFLALWVWSMIIIAWLFRWFNHPGNGSGTALNTEIFLEKLRSSYRATLKNLIFGWMLGAVQILFSSAWVYREISSRDPITVRQFITLKVSLCIWLCTAFMFIWTVRVFSKLRAELAAIEKLQNEWNCPEALVGNTSGLRKVE